MDQASKHGTEQTQAAEHSSDEAASKSLESLSRQKPVPLLVEFCLFVREHKAWWLVPILLSLGALALAVSFHSTGAAPFIYTLF